MANQIEITPQSHKHKCGIDNDAWELASSGSTRSASNASPRETSARQVSLPAISLPTMSLGRSDSDSEMESDSEAEINTSSRRPFQHQSSQKPTPTLVQLLAKLPSPEAAPQGLKGLVTYLRQENTLLREALIRLQQEVEDVSTRHAQGETQNVDFAHLLELAREFGDLCNSQETKEDQEEDAACNFSISTPRNEKRCALEDDNDSKLRSDLEFSRREVARLEAMVAEREAARHLGQLES
mmetsp:Transcript_15066/g.23772  ORF Transcript_15066/g.23772 Transcript_15066/m.23772 type:complete len:240 (+) Transcript_15066:55-774(+)